jgi:hypothetical protein
MTIRYKPQPWFDAQGDLGVVYVELHVRYGDELRQAHLKLLAESFA